MENRFEQDKFEQEGRDAEAEGMDFDSMLKEKAFRSEFDRRISRALETARGKWNQEAEQRLQQAREDGERIVRMKEETNFARREADLNAREQQIYMRELRANAVYQLHQRSLPDELADALNYANEETMLSSMNAVEQAFRAAVQMGIEDRLRGTAPSRARSISNADVSDSDYYSMRYGSANAN